MGGVKSGLFAVESLSDHISSMEPPILWRKAQSPTNEYIAHESWFNIIVEGVGDENRLAKPVSAEWPAPNPPHSPFEFRSDFGDSLTSWGWWAPLPRGSFPGRSVPLRSGGRHLTISWRLSHPWSIASLLRSPLWAARYGFSLERVQGGSTWTACRSRLLLGSDFRTRRSSWSCGAPGLNPVRLNGWRFLKGRS